jgi:hypothetical protein
MEETKSSFLDDEDDEESYESSEEGPTEWEYIETYGIRVNDDVFAAIEVAHDCDSFFHSLALSRHVDFNDGHLGRQHYVNGLRGILQTKTEMGAQMRQEIAYMKVNQEEYLQQMQLGKIVTFEEVRLACVVFNIRICVVLQIAKWMPRDSSHVSEERFTFTIIFTNVLLP